MRLNQLAKKVGKPYTRVEKFLVKDCGLEGIDGPNTKVDEEVIEKVIYKFGLAADNKEETPKKVVLKTIEAVAANIKPEEKGIEEADLAINAPTPAEAVKPVINLEDVQVNAPKVTPEEPKEVVSIIEEKLEAEPVEVTPEAVPAVEEELTEEKAPEKVTLLETEETTLHLDADGVIKAPKVELEGIKVMGKIDLPQPKVEEPVEATEASEAEATPEAEAPKVEEKKPAKPKKKKPSANEIEARRQKRLAAQKKAEREAFELENAEKLQKEKEAKKQHYKNQMANSQPAKKKVKKSKVNEADAQEAKATKSFEQKHKYEGQDNLTTWQKIVKWFNT